MSANAGGAEDLFLASFCIVGLGISGRDAAETYLETFKSSEMPEEGREFLGGAVVTAAFYYSTAREKGRMHFVDSVLMRHDEGEVFASWKRTETGKKWMDWYLQLRRIPGDARAVDPTTTDENLHR